MVVHLKFTPMLKPKEKKRGRLWVQIFISLDLFQAQRNRLQS